MPPTIQVGAILMKDWPAMNELLWLECEPYSGEWTLLKILDVRALYRKIHAAGWNFLFIATEVKAMFFGSISSEGSVCIEADFREGKAAAFQWP